MHSCSIFVRVFVILVIFSQKVLNEKKKKKLFKFLTICAEQSLHSV